MQNKKHLFAEINDYHSDTDFITSSMLKVFADSPRLYQMRYIEKTWLQKQSRAFDIGHAVHCRVLEPDEFSDRFVIESEDVNRRTKAYKEQKQACEADGKTMLAFEDYKIACTCEAALQRHPITRSILNADGLYENVHCWTDPETGLQCKFRADKIIIEKRILLDLKTAADASEEAFKKSAAYYKYYLQAAHYIEGAANLTQTSVDDWRMIFATVRTQAPFDSFAFQFDDDSLDYAFRYRRSILQQIADSTKANVFASEGESTLITISLPKWSLRENI